MIARRRAVTAPRSLPLGMAHVVALRRGWVQWTTFAIGAALLLALPALVSKFWLHLANLCLIAVVGAVALNLLTGNARLVSLGQAAFLGVGGFTAGLLHRAYQLPFPAVLLAAAAAGAAVGLIVAIPSLRLRVLYVAVTTLALHFAVTTFFAFVQAEFLDSTGMILPIPSLGPLELAGQLRWYYVLLVVAAAVVVGALNVLRSFVGRRWIAVGEHDVAAEALGVSAVRAKLSVFIASSAVVAFAGALSAYYVGTVSFESYNLGLAISYLAMIIVGGVGSVLGSVLGAVLITLLPYLLDQFSVGIGLNVHASTLAGVQEAVFGGLIVGFLLFEPRGLAEIWRRVRTAAADWPFRYRAAQRATR
jgi:branched-chain amino acid transport system permease protein